VTLKKYATAVSALTFLLFFPPLLNSSYITHLFISALYFGTLGSTFDLSIGYMGLLNFGFAGFIGVGAYFSALVSMQLGISPWITLLLSGVTSALLGFFVGILTLRFRGFYMAMFTWFFAEALRFMFAAWVPLTRGYSGIHSIPTFPTLKLPFATIDFTSITRLPYYYLMLAITIITLIILRKITSSDIGLAFRAIREDEVASEAMGIDTLRYKVLNLTISCFFAGLLGSFYAHYITVLTPDIMATWHTVEIIAITYVGGRRSLWGPIIAAFLIIFLLEVLRPLLIIRLIIYGALLLFAMLFLRRGLAGLLQKLFKF